MKRHSGRYSSKKAASDYMKALLKAQPNLTITIEPVTYYDVYSDDGTDIL
jgi:hypothetical protein